MKLLSMLSKIDLIPQQKLLEFYPPFLFMGVKVKRVSRDHRSMDVIVPLRWYGKNMYGAMFGGFICAVADPLPALMCGKIFPGVEMWTKSNAVDFLKPGRSTLEAHIHISELDVAAIGRQLDTEHKASHRFEFYFRDKHGHEIAHVKNEIYLRRRR
jgi:acyl-coenzyme A thioesterase PaaI-like protein